jgi:hypothetical protein
VNQELLIVGAERCITQVQVIHVIFITDMMQVGPMLDVSRYSTLFLFVDLTPQWNRRKNKTH